MEQEDAGLWREGGRTRRDLRTQEPAQWGTSGFCFCIKHTRLGVSYTAPWKYQYRKKKGRDVGKEENKPLKANSLPKGPEKE